MEINIKKHLREIRIFLGMSQTELARKASFQPSAIAHFESGRREPTTKNVAKLSEALGVSVDRLMFGVKDDKR